VFIDTPGLHDPDSALGRQMMHEVAAAVEGIDILLLIVDASHISPHTDTMLIEKAKRFHGKTILALNKVDAVPKPKLLPLIDRFRQEFEFAAIVPLSALKGTGCNALLDEIFRHLPEAQPFFPEDQVTDQPERFLAAEIIREKAIRALHHELPYAVAVFVEKFEDNPRLLRIEAVLNVERDTQKKILIGHKARCSKRSARKLARSWKAFWTRRCFSAYSSKSRRTGAKNPQRVRELDWPLSTRRLEQRASRPGRRDRR